MLEDIVEDEGRHAGLAWQTIEWIFEASGSHREAVLEALEQQAEAMAAKGMETDADIVRLVLESSDVVMVPGTPFGAPGYVRISFACSIEELQDAIGRIRKALS